MLLHVFHEKSLFLVGRDYARVVQALMPRRAKSLPPLLMLVHGFSDVLRSVVKIHLPPSWLSSDLLDLDFGVLLTGDLFLSFLR